MGCFFLFKFLTLLVVVLDAQMPREISPLPKKVLTRWIQRAGKKDREGFGRVFKLTTKMSYISNFLFKNLPPYLGR